jgi:oligopeptide transport system ATP-binding protein
VSSFLSIEHVAKHYPVRRPGLISRWADDLRAVDDVSFELEPGETLGVVGESGCGKSTLARILLRLERPTSGRVLYRGRDLAEMGRDDLRGYRRKVQIVFQDPYSSLNPTMTVGALVTEPWRIHHTVRRRDRRARAIELLESVGVDPDYYKRRPTELSGGERQRIGVARALALEPEIIVCDEPASALDVSVQAQILTLLKRLQGELGLSYVFISHDLSVVRYLAHRVAVMYLGRIVEMGEAAAVYERPRHPYTRGLLDVARQLHGDAAESLHDPAIDDPPDAPVQPGGCRFAPRCPRKQPYCLQADPPLAPMGDGQSAACFHPVPVPNGKPDAST